MWVENVSQKSDSKKHEKKKKQTHKTQQPQTRHAPTHKTPRVPMLCLFLVRVFFCEVFVLVEGVFFFPWASFVFLFVFVGNLFLNLVIVFFFVSLSCLSNNFFNNVFESFFKKSDWTNDWQKVIEKINEKTCLKNVIENDWKTWFQNVIPKCDCKEWLQKNDWKTSLKNVIWKTVLETSVWKRWLNKKIANMIEKSKPNKWWKKEWFKQVIQKKWCKKNTSGCVLLWGTGSLCTDVDWSVLRVNGSWFILLGCHSPSESKQETSSIRVIALHRLESFAHVSSGAGSVSIH